MLFDLYYVNGTYVSLFSLRCSQTKHLYLPLLFFMRRIFREEHYKFTDSEGWADSVEDRLDTPKLAHIQQLILVHKITDYRHNPVNKEIK